MKKIISLLTVLLAVIIGGGIVFYWTQNSAANPQKELGTAQTIENKSGATTVTIAKPGYYDVTVISADVKAGEAYWPEKGQTTVGTYYQKNQQLPLPWNAVIQFSPAQFIKLSEPLSLKYNGNYLVGTQFPAGTYQATLVGNLGTQATKSGTTAIPVQLAVFTPEANGSKAIGQSYELTNAKPTVSLPLKNGEMLQLKISDNVSISLKK